MAAAEISQADFQQVAAAYPYAIRYEVAPERLRWLAEILLPPPAPRWYEKVVLNANIEDPAAWPIFRGVYASVGWLMASLIVMAGAPASQRDSNWSWWLASLLLPGAVEVLRFVGERQGWGKSSPGCRGPRSGECWAWRSSPEIRFRSGDAYSFWLAATLLAALLSFEAYRRFQYLVVDAIGYLVFCGVVVNEVRSDGESPFALSISCRCSPFRCRSCPTVSAPRRAEAAG